MGKIVTKFGGSSLADASQFQKVKSILDMDKRRCYVVPSAPGRRFDGDDKITDLLYKCYRMRSNGEDINPLLNILFLYFFYRLGSAVEYTIGTFKFNLFYGSGVLLMVGFAMIFCPLEDMIIGNYLVQAEDFTYLYGGMSGYLHLSLVLAYATSYPESRFYIFYIIPIPAWVLALVYLVLTGISVFNMCVPVNLLPHALFPLIGLLNYFLFFGADMHNLIPLSWRAKKRQREMAGKGRVGKTIQFPTNADAAKKPAAVKADYNHKCDVCGRTDVTDPELEFRYCSRCRGYHCYCEDHINNHTHIE